MSAILDIIYYDESQYGDLTKSYFRYFNSLKDIEREIETSNSKTWRSLERKKETIEYLNNVRSIMISYIKMP